MGLSVSTNLYSLLAAQGTPASRAPMTASECDERTAEKKNLPVLSEDGKSFKTPGTKLASESIETLDNGATRKTRYSNVRTAGNSPASRISHLLTKAPAAWSRSKIRQAISHSMKKFSIASRTAASGAPSVSGTNPAKQRRKSPRTIPSLIRLSSQAAIFPPALCSLALSPFTAERSLIFRPRGLILP